MMTVNYKIILAVLVWCSIWLDICDGNLHTSDNCKCENVDGCRHGKDPSGSFEVIAVTNYTKDMVAWKWDSITAVITTSDIADGEANRVACTTHINQKNYGFTVTLPAINNSNAWLDGVKLKIQAWYADIVVVDMLNLFQKPFNSSSHSLGETEELMKSLNQAGIRKVFCIVPWSPPCNLEEESDCELVIKLLNHCSLLLISPDSFLPSGKESCRAQATVPVSKLLYGIDRYVVMLSSTGEDPRNKIVVGIPWHGYTFACKNLTKNNMCILDNSTDDQLLPCKYSELRVRKKLGDIHDTLILEEEEKVDKVQEAAYHNYLNKEQNKTYQVWYETRDTLTAKYHLVHMLLLRGLAVWRGDDLNYGLGDIRTTYDWNMWNWAMHDSIIKTVSQPIERSHTHTANTVAGVGVGCLLLGVVLGVIFTCIALRRNLPQRINRPFKLDEDADEYRDDPSL